MIDEEKKFINVQGVPRPKYNYKSNNHLEYSKVVRPSLKWCGLK